MAATSVRLTWQLASSYHIMGDLKQELFFSFKQLLCKTHFCLQQRSNLCLRKMGVPSPGTKCGRYITALLKYDLTSCLVASPRFWLAINGWTFWQIKNPTNNFCKAWSEDCLCQTSRRLDKTCDLWKLVFLIKSKMVENPVWQKLAAWGALNSARAKK